MGTDRDGGRVMRIDLEPLAVSHCIRVHLGFYGSPRWAFPAVGSPNECVIYATPDGSDEFAAAPSADLVALCESRAPWFAVLDKLIEEYPQWESHFAAAAARMHATASTSQRT